MMTISEGLGDSLNFNDISSPPGSLEMISGKLCSPCSSPTQRARCAGLEPSLSGACWRDTATALCFFYQIPSASSLVFFLLFYFLLLKKLTGGSSNCHWSVA